MTPHRRDRSYNENGVGRNLRKSLSVMVLEPGATVREVNVRYWFLDHQLHPDKHDPEETGITSEEAVEIFRLVNNAQQFLHYTICK